MPVRERWSTPKRGAAQFKLVFRRYGDSPEGRQRMTMDIIRLTEAVPHGRFVLVHRMGHLPSAPVWPELVSEISQHAT